MMRRTADLSDWRKLPIGQSHRRRRPLFPWVSSRRILRFLPILVLLALVPPIFFHFRLQRLQQMRLQKCSWLDNAPLVCAHGGDSSKATPNTMDAYRLALSSHVDCIEIDVSRTSDGMLFALHDRDLQRMSGNNSVRVGYLNTMEVKRLDAAYQLAADLKTQEVPTIEDALLLVSKSVRQVILDIKIGPPSYEKDMAKDILSIVKSTRCENCVVWAKNDNIVRDVINLSTDVMAGYIVMNEPSTGTRSNLLRMKGADVVGVYHPLIDEKLMRILHGRKKKVYAWTVDDEPSMRKLLSESVDAIVTGKPSVLQDLMESIKIECIEEGYRLA